MLLYTDIIQLHIRGTYKDLLQQSDFNGWHVTNRQQTIFFVWVVFLLFALNCRWSDPDNKSVTAKVVSEVKAQFPHFAEGDIKGNYFLSAVVYTNSVYKCLILLASCKRNTKPEGKKKEQVDE